MTTITARQVFGAVDPASRAAAPVHRSAAAPVRRSLARELRPRACLRMLAGYYRDPLAWFGLFGTLLIVAYAGGAVMFILHGVVLGELGPAISPTAHWILDSTLGFIGLGPVVAVLVPLSAWAVTRDPQAPVRPWPYALVSGILFALAAGPGPIAHDLLVGRGTWLANRVTELLGNGATHVHAAQGDGVSQTLSIACQLAVGVPTYIALMWGSLAVVRAAVRHRGAVQAARAVLTGPEPAGPATVE